MHIGMLLVNNSLLVSLFLNLDKWNSFIMYDILTSAFLKFGQMFSCMADQDLCLQNVSILSKDIMCLVQQHLESQIHFLFYHNKTTSRVLLCLTYDLNFTKHIRDEPCDFIVC